MCSFVRHPVWRGSTSVPQFALSKFLPFGSVYDRMNPIRIARRQALVERLIPAIHSPIADRFLCKASGAGTTASGNTRCATSGSRSRSAPCASAASPRYLTWRMELAILMSKRTRCEAGSQNDILPGIVAPNCAGTQPAPPPSTDSMSELSHPSISFSTWTTAKRANDRTWDLSSCDGVLLHVTGLRPREGEQYLSSRQHACRVRPGRRTWLLRKGIRAQCHTPIVNDSWPSSRPQAD